MEIKEILYKLDSISNGAYNNYGYVDLKQDEAKLLIDYITNLQQENEKLINEPLTYKISRIDSVCANIYKEYNDYKSRIDKAIEYFEYQLSQLDFEKDTMAKMLCAMALVILRGEDNE